MNEIFRAAAGAASVSIAALKPEAHMRAVRRFDDHVNLGDGTLEMNQKHLKF